MKKKLLIICIILALAATGVIYGFTYRTTTTTTPVKKATKTECTKYKSCSKKLQARYNLKNCNGSGIEKTSVATVTHAALKN